MCRRLSCLIVLLTLFANGCGKIKESREAAERQVTFFHQRFNDQDMKSIVTAAHPDLWKTSSKAEVLEFLSAVRQKLGKANDSQTLSWNVQAGMGVTNATLVQKTTFEAGEGTETFIYRVEKKKASLLGYKIVSKDLIMK